MHLNIWTLLLIVFASQCLFLIIGFSIRPLSNKKATTVLISLLSIILCTTISNFLSASYLYRVIPKVAGFARGMVLLLGPVLYLYTLSILKPTFQFKAIQLLHFVPFVIGFIIIYVQRSAITDETFIADVDSLVAGHASMDWASTIWFICYFIHLLIYIAKAKRVMKLSLNTTTNNYLMPIEQRVIFLKKLSLLFFLIALVMLADTCYIIITRQNTITCNFIYNVVLAFMVYLIAYQSASNAIVLLPDFTTKYKSAIISEQSKDLILSKLLHLFEDEKLFTDSELKLAIVAEKLEIHPHILSQAINDGLHKTFNELLNYYRIKEFKIKATDPQYAKYSIVGIAYEVGYNSKSSFNGEFKKQNGITPSAYLKSSIKK